MAIFFCDSSAVVKRYITETGTVWLEATIDPAQGNRVYVARITFVEVIADTDLNNAAIAENLTVDNPNNH